MAAGLLVAGIGVARLREETPEPAPPASQPPPRLESAPEPLTVQARPIAVQAPPEAPVPIEDAAATVDPRHFQAMLALARARQDAVDDCRDRISLPPVDKLRAWSTGIERIDPNNAPAEEISMQQTILFEVATTKGAYRLLSATVVDTWLEFPRDGWIRRAPFSDPSLERCVEGALAGARVESPGVVAGERFRIQGRAGEAVYDLR